jgi:hypothetical protein
MQLRFYLGGENEQPNELPATVGHIMPFVVADFMLYKVHPYSLSSCILLALVTGSRQGILPLFYTGKPMFFPCLTPRNVF